MEVHCENMAVQKKPWKHGDAFVKYLFSSDNNREGQALKVTSFKGDFFQRVKDFNPSVVRLNL
jgi:hypothetical protein